MNIHTFLIAIPVLDGLVVQVLHRNLSATDHGRIGFAIACVGDFERLIDLTAELRL